MINRTIIASRDLAIRPGTFHIEVEMSVNRVEFFNSCLIATAIVIQAPVVTLDTHSSLNVSVKGLKYGPGYYDWTPFGASYGGMGGITLNDETNSCKDIDPPVYMREIGSIRAENTYRGVGEFRGYGSGGGDDTVRGGGLINITSNGSISIDGRLVSNGGHCSTESRGAGSGGTILVQAINITGAGTIQANGGDAYPYDTTGSILTSSGGGGGGGGGRIVLHYLRNEIDPSKVEAKGGQMVEKKDKLSGPCQAGGDGTILELSPSHRQMLVGSLLIRGRSSQEPRVVGTILLFRAYNNQVPDWLRRVSIAQTSIVFTFNLQLQRSFGGVLSELQVQKGSQIVPIVDESSIQLAAAHVDISGVVGYPTRKTDLSVEATTFVVTGGSIYTNHLSVMCSQQATIDSSSLIDFTDAVVIEALLRVEFQGFATSDHQNGATNITLRTLQDALVSIQPAQTRQLDLTVIAGGLIKLTIPQQSPYISISLYADEIKVVGKKSGTAPQCGSFNTKDDVCQSRQHNYGMGLFGSTHVKVSDISFGSILICSPKTTFTGLVQGLGCLPGKGKGRGIFVASASGGASHGGKGGDIERNGKRVAASGPVYDSLESPSWTGSGAASGDTSKTIGGSGGGLVYVNSHYIHFDNTSLLTVAGTAGVEHGGGGSGGTIVMLTWNLTGNGTIDLSGGASLPSSEHEIHTFGGGGGGGRLHLVFMNESIHANETNSTVGGTGQAFQEAGGRIVLNGGRSSGQGGEPGRASPHTCAIGHGGILCLACHPGFFSPNHTSECLKCPPGAMSNNYESQTCTLCHIGHYNPNNGSVQCFPCPIGTFASLRGETFCSQCQPGTFSKTTGATNCTKCPIGYISEDQGASNCTICPIGFTTDSIGQKHCRGCIEKPKHSTFNQPGSCTYACDKGRTGLDCLTPFERFVKPIGGPIGFVLIVFGLMLSIFTIWGVKSYRQTEDDYNQWKKSTLHQAFLHHNVFTPRLNDTDLRGHVERLIFSGHNDFDSPWQLLARPSAALEPHIYISSYDSFARKCTKIMGWDLPSWRYTFYRFVTFFSPPLAPSLLQVYRLDRIRHLARHVIGYKGGFFRDLNSQLNAIELKLGVSPCLTLGYIDIIWTTSLASATHLSREPGTFTLPMELPLAGTGSFLQPFYLDTNDILVRSVPTRANLLSGECWIELIASLNRELRMIIYENERDFNRVRQVLFQFNQSQVFGDLEIKLDKTSLVIDTIASSPRERAISTATCTSTDSVLETSSIRRDALYASSSDESDTTSIDSVAVSEHLLISTSEWYTKGFKLPSVSTTSVNFRRPATVLAILTADLVITWLFLMEIECIQVSDPTSTSTGCSHLTLIIVLSCFPLTLVISPFMVLWFIWQRDSTKGRLVCIWHYCSMLNFILGAVCCLFYWEYLSPFAFILSILALLIKHIEKQMILSCVAQFEQQRPVPGWRGLCTTQDYYDAPTNPLIMK